MRNGSNPKVQGPVDLYEEMLYVKNGHPAGYTVGFTWVTKKQAKECDIPWSFVENSVALLGLNMEPHGKLGFIITK